VILPKELDEDELDEALANAMEPFDENTRVDAYVYETVAEIKARRVKDIEHYEKTLADPKNNDSETVNTPRHKDWVKSMKSEIEKLTAMTDKEYYEYRTEGYELNEKGDIVSTYNPESHWDVYGTANYLDLHDGRKESAARVKDVRFEPTEAEILTVREKYRRLQKLSKLSPEKRRKRNIDDVTSLLGFDPKMTEDEFVADETSKSFCSCLDMNGEWHEDPESGWFVHGKTWAANFKKTFIDTLDPDDWVVAVDCHI